MYTLLGITLLLTACVDDDKDLSQPKEPEKTTDLIIPDDADWTTTRSVNLSIHSPVATRVAILPTQHVLTKVCWQKHPYPISLKVSNWM